MLEMDVFCIFQKWIDVKGLKALLPSKLPFVKTQLMKVVPFCRDGLGLSAVNSDERVKGVNASSHDL